MEDLGYLDSAEITYDICRCLCNLRLTLKRVKQGREETKGGKFYTGLLHRGIVRPDFWNSMQITNIGDGLVQLDGRSLAFVQPSPTRNDYGLNTRARFMV